MSAQVYSIPDLADGRRKDFLEWKSIGLSYKPSLTCGVNVNYYKNVHHPIPSLENSGNFQNKSVSPTISWVSRYIFFLAKLKGRGRPFWGRERPVCHKKWKGISFCETLNIPIPPLFLLDSLTNKHCRTWSSIINLRIDSRTHQK